MTLKAILETVAAVGSALLGIAATGRALSKHPGRAGMQLVPVTVNSGPAGSAPNEQVDNEQVRANPATTNPPDARLREGWSIPQPAELPRPTYWPIVMALGIVCIFWGIVSTYMLTLVGVVLFAMALIGWIGEMLHEHENGNH